MDNNHTLSFDESINNRDFHHEVPKTRHDVRLLAEYLTLNFFVGTVFARSASGKHLNKIINNPHPQKSIRCSATKQEVLNHLSSELPKYSGPFLLLNLPEYVDEIISNGDLCLVDHVAEQGSPMDGFACPLNAAHQCIYRNDPSQLNNNNNNNNNKFICDPSILFQANQSHKQQQEQQQEQQESSLLASSAASATGDAQYMWNIWRRPKHFTPKALGDTHQHVVVAAPHLKENSNNNNNNKDDEFGSLRFIPKHLLQNIHLLNAALVETFFTFVRALVTSRAGPEFDYARIDPRSFIDPETSNQRVCDIVSPKFRVHFFADALRVIGFKHVIDKENFGNSMAFLGWENPTVVASLLHDLTAYKVAVQFKVVKSNNVALDTIASSAKVAISYLETPHIAKGIAKYQPSLAILKASANTTATTHQHGSNISNTNTTNTKPPSYGYAVDSRPSLFEKPKQQEQHRNQCESSQQHQLLLRVAPVAASSAKTDSSRDITATAAAQVEKKKSNKNNMTNFFENNNNNNSAALFAVRDNDNNNNSSSNNNININSSSNNINTNTSSSFTHQEHDEASHHHHHHHHHQTRKTVAATCTTTTTNNNLKDVFPHYCSSIPEKDSNKNLHQNNNNNGNNNNNNNNMMMMMNSAETTNINNNNGNNNNNKKNDSASFFIGTANSNNNSSSSMMMTTHQDPQYSHHHATENTNMTMPPYRSLSGANNSNNQTHHNSHSHNNAANNNTNDDDDHERYSSRGGSRHRSSRASSYGSSSSYRSSRASSRGSSRASSRGSSVGSTHHRSNRKAGTGSARGLSNITELYFDHLNVLVPPSGMSKDDLIALLLFKEGWTADQQNGLLAGLCEKQLIHFNKCADNTSRFCWGEAPRDHNGALPPAPRPRPRSRPHHHHGRQQQQILQNQNQNQQQPRSQQQPPSQQQPHSRHQKHQHHDPQRRGREGENYVVNKINNHTQNDNDHHRAPPPPYSASNFNNYYNNNNNPGTSHTKVVYGGPPKGFDSNGKRY